MINLYWADGEYLYLKLPKKQDMLRIFKIIKMNKLKEKCFEITGFLWMKN